MKRIAIIAHNSHTLFVEDVNEKILEKYNGNIKAYIEDNYCISGKFSWDYITSAQYLPETEETEVYDIDYSELTK